MLLSTQSKCDSPISLESIIASNDDDDERVCNDITQSAGALSNISQRATMLANLISSYRTLETLEAHNLHIISGDEALKCTYEEII